MTRETLAARGFRAGSQQGVMSVTVPGALAGWDVLLRTHGRAHARAGARSRRSHTRATASPSRRSSPRSGRTRPTFLQRDSAAAATFLPGGRAPKAGEWFRNPDYARTLQEIADSGIGTFYGGALGQRIVARLTR